MNKVAVGLAGLSAILCLIALGMFAWDAGLLQRFILWKYALPVTMVVTAFVTWITLDFLEWLPTILSEK